MFGLAVIAVGAVMQRVARRPHEWMTAPTPAAVAMSDDPFGLAVDLSSSVA